MENQSEPQVVIDYAQIGACLKLNPTPPDLPNLLQPLPNPLPTESR